MPDEQDAAAQLVRDEAPDEASLHDSVREQHRAGYGAALEHRGPEELRA